MASKSGRLKTRRELRRLKMMPRYTPTVSNLLGIPLTIVDSASFLSAFYQIFQHRIYDFEVTRNDPRILDCGANIGLATLFWKGRYPNARITAFEPDPAVFAVLSENCRTWRLDHVSLVNAAVWDREGLLEFHAEGSDAGRIADDLEGSGPRISVEAVRLREYLGTPVDMLKLDIEGAETAVLLDCEDRLENVEKLFVEYHSFQNREQLLDQILRLLRATGFRVHVQTELAAATPFLERPVDLGMDQRLNLFAVRA